MNLTRMTVFNGNADITIFLDMPYLVDADYIKDFMARHKLTSAGLSNLLKVSIKEIDKWLSGEKLINATAATLMQLVDQIPYIVESYREQVKIDPDTELQFNIC